MGRTGVLALKVKGLLSCVASLAAALLAGAAGEWALWAGAAGEWALWAGAAGEWALRSRVLRGPSSTKDTKQLEGLMSACVQYPCSRAEHAEGMHAGMQACTWSTMSAPCRHACRQAPGAQ